MLGTAVTTLGWLASAWLLPPEREEVLRSFVAKPESAALVGATFNPMPPQEQRHWRDCPGIPGVHRGHGALMATGSLLYGHGARAAVLFVVSGLAAGAVLFLHRRS